MDSVSASSSSSDQLYSLVGMPAVASSTQPTSSTSTSNNIGPAATVLLSSLQMQGQEMATLFSGLATATSPTIFGGSSAMSLLNAQGSAALQYLLPAGSTPGQTLDASA